MKTLVISDRAPNIDIIQTTNNENIELIITLGDLTREEILPLEHIKHIPKIGVYGNHDSGNYMEELGIWNMHMMTWDYKGLKFGGFQGCVRYKPNPTAIMYTQEEALAMMQGYPAVDIFISHCPPRGINDEDEISHQGYIALRNYLEINRPKIWMHGHTYPTEDNIVKQFEDTRIEYVYRQKIIEI